MIQMFDDALDSPDEGEEPIIEEWKWIGNEMREKYIIS
jgi:hypothetical protein